MSALFVFLVSRYCFGALPQDAMGLSAVNVCGNFIFSLTIYVSYINLIIFLKVVAVLKNLWSLVEKH